LNDSSTYIVNFLSGLLPPALFEICKKFIVAYPDISEIRIRRAQQVIFTLDVRNIVSAFYCDVKLFDETLNRLIGNDRYKKSNTITEGIISLDGGFRVGIVGSALLDKGELINIYSITALNIRLPHDYKNSSLRLYEYLTTLPFQHRSTLLIAPPCSGKTTVLRDIARILSSPPVSERVCVVDPKLELSAFRDNNAIHMDIFSGYPTPLGIELATRYFNPRYIVCDEIGQVDELKAIESATHSGIPIIASAHSSSLQEALSKPVLRELLEETVFYNVVKLSLVRGETRFDFYGRKEVERALCAPKYSLV